MAERQWYTGRDGKQDGPFSDQRLRELIAGGVVRADTLIWSAGMTNWSRAADVPGLMPAGRGPSGVPSSPGFAGPTEPTGPLSANIGVWALFWRMVIYDLAIGAIIPLPWIAVVFVRWFVERISVPGTRGVSFAGKPGDIWWVFVLYAVSVFLPFLILVPLMPEHVELIGGLVPIAILLILLFLLFLELVFIRWVFANLIWENQATRLRFTGGYWGLLGWSVFQMLSIITIIGPAWVSTAWARWMCRHVEGSSRELIFTGSGWGLLWRIFLAYIACLFIIPIPWMMRWITCWLISKLALVERGQA
jgi:GYF domain 2